MSNPAKSVILLVMLSLLFSSFTQTTFADLHGTMICPVSVTPGQQFDVCLTKIQVIDKDEPKGTVITFEIYEGVTTLLATNTYTTSRIYKVGEFLPDICLTLKAPSQSKTWELAIYGWPCQPGCDRHNMISFAGGYRYITVAPTSPVPPDLTATTVPPATTTPGPPSPTPPGPTPGGPPTGQPPTGSPPFPPTGPATASPKPEIIPSPLSSNFTMILAIAIIALIAIVAGYLIGRRRKRDVVTCSKCGHTSESDTKFCPECGTKL